MREWVYLSLGGWAGVAARYVLGGAVSRRLGAGLPWGTLAVNLSGCLLVGLFHGLAQDKLLLGPRERLMLMTGFCGAYTTFSTLMMETSALSGDGEWILAMANLLISVALGFALFRIGVWLGRAF